MNLRVRPARAFVTMFASRGKKPASKSARALETVRGVVQKIRRSSVVVDVEKSLMRSWRVYKKAMTASKEFKHLRKTLPGWVMRNARFKRLAWNDDFACAFVLLSPVALITLLWCVGAVVRMVMRRDANDVYRKVFGKARERQRSLARREAEAKMAKALPNQPPETIDRTQSGTVINMTTKDSQKLFELRTKLDEAVATDETLLATPALRAFVTDACLCRYLRARKWKVDKALKMLIETLRWRAERKPEALTWDDIENEASTGKQYRSGRDKRGRRVLVMRPDRENTFNHVENIKFLIYTLENILWKSSRPGEPLGSNADLAPEQITILIDFTKWSLKNAVPMATARETLSILQNHYPERLGLAVCFNPPTIFRVFWAVISPFIDPKTYTKIVFVSKRRKAKAAATMGAIFHAASTDTDLGGAVDPTWNFNDYAKHMRDYDAKKLDVTRTWA